MSSNYRGNGPPPQPNPILTQYESFVDTTPLVTRYVLTTLVLSWILSWFANISYSLANVPLFSIMQFELYRILLSPLVCSNLLTLIFAFMSFIESGKRLEFSIGSTAFAVLLSTIAMMTNISFLIVCFACYGLTGQNSWLVLSSQGIWIIILGMIAVECSNAPRDSTRRLFFLVVPTIYYPCAIFALFTLFSGFMLAYLLAIGVGYAYGYGYLDKLRFSNATFTRWEDGCLRNFTQRKGWVVGHAATGANAWLPINAGAGAESSQQQQQQSWTPTSFFQGQNTNAQQQSSASGTVASPPDGGWKAPGKVSSPPAFPSSKGKALGGTGNKKDTEAARNARLAALEKRSNATMSEDGDNN